MFAEVVLIFVEVVCGEVCRCCGFDYAYSGCGDIMEVVMMIC